MIERLGIDGFAHPWMVPLALGLAVAVAIDAARRAPAVLPWPAWPEALAAGLRRRELGRGIAIAARGAAIALLGVAIAGPVREHRAPPPPGLGLDLLLVIDTSESMQALDAELGGAFRTRLELAREVVARFAARRIEDGDRVGLVVFGETAFTQSPLSSDGRLLEAALGRTRPGMAGGATALGDALALAVKRVTALEPTSGADGPGTGRLVVLLTDGRHNAGAIPPDVAAGLAAQRGVRVHTVGIGGEGEVAMARPGAEGRRGLRLERHDLDTGTLEAIAVATGGRYFEARRSSDLEAVYASIDALERVPRPAPPRRRQAPHPEPFLAGAAVAVALELLCVRGLARRIP